MLRNQGDCISRDRVVDEQQLFVEPGDVFGIPNRNLVLRTDAKVDVRSSRRVRRADSGVGPRHLHAASVGSARRFVAEVDGFARQAIAPEMGCCPTFTQSTQHPINATPLLHLVAFSGRTIQRRPITAAQPHALAAPTRRCSRPIRRGSRMDP